MSDGSSGEGQFHFETPQLEERPSESHEPAADQAAEKARPVENRPAERPAAAEKQPTAQPIILPPATDDQAAATDDSAPADNEDKPSATVGKETPIVEKQWVDKAKAILAKNKTDPYVQKKAMSDFKADYIQKRFNKSIPRDDAVKA